MHIPLSVLEWRVDPTSGHQSPALAGHEGKLILICHEGYSSSLAAVRLHDLGFENTTDVIGGFVAWAEAHLPVERLRSPRGLVFGSDVLGRDVSRGTVVVCAASINAVGRTPG